MGQCYNPAGKISIGPAGQFGLAHLTNPQLPLSGYFDQFDDAPLENPKETSLA
jgi:hypothetical protein